jgi:hypothetical protein
MLALHDQDVGHCAAPFRELVAFPSYVTVTAAEVFKNTSCWHHIAYDNQFTRYLDIFIISDDIRFKIKAVPFPVIQ